MIVNVRAALFDKYVTVQKAALKESKVIVDKKISASEYVTENTPHWVDKLAKMYPNEADCADMIEVYAKEVWTRDGSRIGQQQYCNHPRFMGSVFCLTYTHKTCMMDK